MTALCSDPYQGPLPSKLDPSHPGGEVQPSVRYLSRTTDRTIYLFEMVPTGSPWPLWALQTVLWGSLSTRYVVRKKFLG